MWAPWRLEYIQNSGSKENKQTNIFLELPKEDNDRENLILFRGKTAFVMLNAYPYNSGHLMIAPYRDTPHLDALNDEELLEINQLLAKSMKWLHSAYQPHGYNVGVNIGACAGAGIVDHIHWHIVPRWGGDTNFMPVTAETKVLPENLLQTYDKLRKVINEQS